MSTRESHGGPRVELYVRSLVTAGSHQHGTAVLDRLEALADREQIGGYDVRVWGREVPATQTDARTEAGLSILDRVERFRTWAGRNGVSLESTFERRDVDAELSGERYRSLVLPTFLLAEYRDGGLACVTPHETDERVYTVADRLEQLARERSLGYEPLEAGRSDEATSRIDAVSRVEAESDSPVEAESDSPVEAESDSRVEAESDSPVEAESSSPVESESDSPAESDSRGESGSEAPLESEPEPVPSE